MAQERTASLDLDSLPAEVLYRVLDHLSCEEIFFSFGHVCRRFRHITQTYPRYNIDHSRISKPRFDLICRLIRPEHVLSLTLSNNKATAGQISLFLSSFDMEKFTHLRHLSLSELSYYDREKVEDGLKSCPLVSLTIQSASQAVNLMGRWLSGLVGKRQLLQLTLRTDRSLLDRISWPRDCPLTCLHIEDCRAEDYLLILQQLPVLKTLVVDNYKPRWGNRFPSITYPSLESLTINIYDCWMNPIQSDLSLTPSLRHLELFASCCHDPSIVNGKKWEEFVQRTLFDLETFRFSFTFNCGVSKKAEEFIESFRSPFWLEEKRWFVCAEKSEVLPCQVHLYTMPLCDDHLYYAKVKEQVFAATPSSSETRMEQIQILDISTARLAELGNEEKVRQRVRSDRQNSVSLVRLCRTPKTMEFGFPA